MLALVLLLIAAAAAAAAPVAAEPEPLPFLPEVFENRSSFFNDSHSAAALARFRSAVGEARQTVAAAAEPVTPELRADVLLARAALAQRMRGVVFDKPSIAEINAPIAAYLYGSDIMRAPENETAVRFDENIRNKRGAPVVTATKWSKTRPIAFIFNADIPESLRVQIRKIIGNLTANTCLSFKENGEGTQLQFHRGGGCWSYVGNAISGKQLISIDSGCDFDGIIGHEISHALGLDHTQNRKDRDAYVSVNLGAVPSGTQHNFAKLADSQNDNFGVPYEFGSDMHYGAYDFSNNGQAVLVAKDVDYVNSMGQRKYLTFNDYKLINSLYKCSENCPTQMVCQNGGYPSPRNCNACVCPDFFTGANCQTPKATVTVAASSAPGKTSFTTPYNVAMYTSGNNYNWDFFQRDAPKIIRAPEGRKIRVTIDKIYAAYGQLSCYGGCPFVGLEFVDNVGGDLTTMGKIFCCTKDQGYSFVSKSNVIGYKAYSSPGMPLEATATYTIV